MTVLERIAAWSASAGPFSAMATERARDAFVDTIGCMIAGRNDEATKAVLTAIASYDDGGDSVVVDGSRRRAKVAAMVNGVAAHALDFDDNFHGATTHASAVLVPALLAMAQERGCDGRALIDAYIVGLEAQAWISEGLNPSHYTAGWHATSTIGCIGTAAAVARLICLDARGIAHAMSIAVSMAGGLKGQFGTPVKPLHSGLAARNAVEAAELSAAGMCGRLDILESPQGYMALCGGTYPRGWSQAQDRATISIEKVGLTTKRHPCCGATHRAIDTLLELRKIHGFNASDVSAVAVQVTNAHARNLSYTGPADEMQARFSMQYCGALALLQDSLSLSDFTPSAVKRPAVRALFPLIMLRTYDEETEQVTKGRLPHLVEVTLKDGRRFDIVRQTAKGEISDPLDAEMRRHKFLDCIGFAGMSVETGTEIYSGLANIAQSDSARIKRLELYSSKICPTQCTKT